MREEPTREGLADGRTTHGVESHAPLGATGLRVPRVVFGASCLGNLYRVYPDDVKLALSREWFAHGPPPAVIDAAGKYGAGLALEVVGRNLRALGVAPEDILISNKLGWFRTPLRGPEPTFEPGAWAGIAHDAEQRIGYRGILDCWRQGCDLLGEPYRPALLSVHDPDEYLAAARDADDRRRRFDDIVEAYRALGELKARGDARAIGIGSKDWRVIREVDRVTRLDWVMLANSLTLFRHPPELLEFVADLRGRRVGIINSAVFQAGFLLGGEYFDYRVVRPENPADAPLFAWRERFFRLCQEHGVAPDVACVQFALSPPGVAAVSINSGSPERLGRAVESARTEVPIGFWRAAKAGGLVDPDYPYVG